MLDHFDFVEETFEEVIQSIDDKFGEGYAKKNPRLVGSLLMTMRKNKNVIRLSNSLTRISNSISRFS